ncbi:hypothetical protein [Streptococcus cuniculipharyngis]|uniref:Uncharacterized protein n=1 Tax=Streptococcus cuniculipharyngis TaxID=1562651 RepID=A0A5C5SH84_9STRE|nr:hypothetical protein [Streptococcus cuniculipharyngis]TWS99291.1 hypothetical protein FRX57_02900 [Streptococcus cuniculipharyngis]
MTQTLFKAYNEFLKKRYGRSASKETYENFIGYCRRGVMENGVKPILNPVNLYAFGCGISSAEAVDLLFEKAVADG